MEGSGDALGAFGALLGASCALLGRLLDALGRLVGISWGSWALKARFWVDFAGVWEGFGDDLGGSWEDLGRLLANFWMNLEEIFAVRFLQALECPDTAPQSWEIIILHMFKPCVEGKHHQVSWPSASEWPRRDSRSVNNLHCQH